MTMNKTTGVTIAKRRVFSFATMLATTLTMSVRLVRARNGRAACAFPNALNADMTGNDNVSNDVLMLDRRWKREARLRNYSNYAFIIPQMFHKVYKLLVSFVNGSVFAHLHKKNKDLHKRQLRQQMPLLSRKLSNAIARRKALERELDTLLASSRSSNS